MRWRVALIAGTWLMQAANFSHAAPPSQRRPDEERRALSLFEESVQAYREGRFEDAVERLLEARRIKPVPVLLYNLGRAHEALGRAAEAADAYAAYLVEDPAAADRRAIEARIALLRQPSPTPAAPVAVVVPVPRSSAPPPGRPVAQVAPWLVTGAGLVALGTGVALDLVAAGKRDEARSEPTQQIAAEREGDAITLHRVGTGVWIGGIVVATVGVVWLAWRALGHPDAPGTPFARAGLAF